ncbi:MAG TPA: thiamine diphosphokinase [Candidatus Xenobia bacterium]
MVVVAGGEPCPPEFLRHQVGPGTRLVAADRGAAYALAAGVVPDEVLGDFDSLEAAVVSDLRQRGVPLHAYRPDKDQSDLELVLDHVLEGPVTELVVLCALGGRLDHLLTNAGVLLSARRHNVSCRVLSPETSLFYVVGDEPVEGTGGDWVTLLAMSDAVEGIWSSGLKYPWRGETLVRGSSLGLSNELLAEGAHIRAESGDLLVVHTRR